jgi:hypothetical protein
MGFRQKIAKIFFYLSKSNLTACHPHEKRPGNRIPRCLR